MLTIPTELYIRGVLWRVVWHAHDDCFWREHECWGATVRERQEIHLDESLRHVPGMLGQVWIHEILHACMPARVADGRPRGLTREIEEAFIEAVDGPLDLVLNQIGWTP